MKQLISDFFEFNFDNNLVQKDHRIWTSKKGKELKSRIMDCKELENFPSFLEKNGH